MPYLNQTTELGLKVLREINPEKYRKECFLESVRVFSLENDKYRLNAERRLFVSNREYK